MKNPKWREAYPQGHKVKYGGKFLTTWSGYSLDLIQTNGGTISANKNRGYEDDQVNFSYTANEDYGFNGWSASKGSFNGNTYTFSNGNASAKGSFEYFGPSITSWKSSNNTSAYTVQPARYDDMVQYNLPTTSTACVIGVHYKIHLDPSLQGQAYATSAQMLFGIAGWEKVWNGSTWQATASNLSTPVKNLLWEGFNTLNLEPVFCPSNVSDPDKTRITNKLSAVNAFAQGHGQFTAYAAPNQTNWQNDWDVKFLITHKRNDNVSTFEPHKSSTVSGYFNNEFVYSASMGLNMGSISSVWAGAGFFKVGQYGYLSAAPGSAKQEIGVFNYDDINNAYRWLMAQN